MRFQHGLSSVQTAPPCRGEAKRGDGAGLTGRGDGNGLDQYTSL